MTAPRIIILATLPLIFGGPFCLAEDALSLAPMAKLQEKAKTKQVEADFMSLSAAMMMFKLNAGDYPTEKQGLKGLVEKPVTDPVPKRWIQIMIRVPKDPWGREYRYAVREIDGKTTHVLISDGPDPTTSADNIERSIDVEAK